MKRWTGGHHSTARNSSPAALGYGPPPLTPTPLLPRHHRYRSFFPAPLVRSFDDLKSAGSEVKVKEAGKLRMEGRKYEVADGDVCYFKVGSSAK